MFDWLSNSSEVLTRLLMLVLFVPCITIHEFAHARTAQGFGDPTARNLGRCTLNPFAHLDLMGTICMFMGLFGWAKPVPVNHFNLHPQRLGGMMVALAGPLSNVAMAVVMGMALRLLAGTNWGGDGNNVHLWTYACVRFMFVINISLAVFNMIPLFPLDGHHVLRENLPERHQEGFMYWQRRYGMTALVAMVFLPTLFPQTAKWDVLAYLQTHAVDFGDSLLAW